MSTPKLKSKQSTSLKAMAPVDAKKLDGLTINDAIDRGLISSIGLPDGGFIFNHNKADVTARYAVINGTGVLCSETLSGKEQEDIEDLLGDLTFTSGQSQEKYKNGKIDPNGDFVTWYRIGMPRGLDLDTANAAVKVAFEAEPAGK